MNLHYFQHVAFEGLASIATWADSRGHEITSTRFYAGDPMPRLFKY
jgi:GMP synthase (glutamine-hydrolysing)